MTTAVVALGRSSSIKAIHLVIVIEVGGEAPADFTLASDFRDIETEHGALGVDPGVHLCLKTHFRPLVIGRVDLVVGTRIEIAQIEAVQESSVMESTRIQTGGQISKKSKSAADESLNASFGQDRNSEAKEWDCDIEILVDVDGVVFPWCFGQVHERKIDVVTN